MNSRQKRKLAYRAKNEKRETPRNLNLIVKVAESGLDPNNKKQAQNGKIIDRLINARRNSIILSSHVGGRARNIHTKKYACGVQRR